ncbi:MAG: patatin-like phospholipase family protein [Rhodoferax sp.]|nr:patatin-like phospholipase family protein [Rhodoferax sp.]MDP3652149.1 patatin-like phospholipase family protein [Rhodoferax sp.]
MTDSATLAVRRIFPTWSGFALFKGLRRTPARCLSLALQGGGAQGAFTWGVLDALLEDPSIAFDGLSGSGSGAMNAVVFADGWVKGGREGARQGLADFWAEIGKHTPSERSPFNLNALRDLLNRQIDFERVRRLSPFKLFVGTVQANTGKLRLFRETELSAQVVLASVCLPKIHLAVEIAGECYRAGSDLANPTVLPLLYDCDSQDVLLVLLSPLQPTTTPRTAQEVEARTMALAFGAHFLREMRMFAYAHAFADPTVLTGSRLDQRLQNMRFHMIDTGQQASVHFSDTTPLAPTPYLEQLRAQGREQAAHWLSAHVSGVGRESTVDIQKYFT